MEGFDGAPGFEGSRARNGSPLVGLGDPERWGGYDEFAVSVPAGAGTFTARGQQIVRMQAPDLLARSWSLQCSFSAVGLVDVGDIETPGYFLEVAGGAGQVSQFGQLDVGFIGRSLAWFTCPQNAAGMMVSGVAILPSPMPASALAITPSASVRKTVAGVAHNVTFRFSVQIAPWSLA